MNDELSTEQLVDKYHLTIDDEGRFSDISNAGARNLIETSFYQAARAAALPRNFSDDDVDYTNAIIDQLRVLHRLIFDDDFTRDSSVTKTELLHILNAPPTTTGDDTLSYCFTYGYADHHTDISQLSRINDDEEN